MPPVVPDADATKASTSAGSGGGADRDDVRFRGGVSLAGGGYIGPISQTVNGVDSPIDIDASGGLGAVNGHIGVQINDLIGVYFVPHLGGGSYQLSAAGIDSGTEGAIDAAATIMIDFTFIDQVFVGVGGGAAVLAPTCTNCDGFGGGTLHVRAGGYPVLGFGDDGIRRQGLMVGLDLRVNFLNVIDAAPGFEASLIAVQPMVTIGYEAF